MTSRTRSVLIASAAIAVLWASAVILLLMQWSSPHPIVLILLGAAGLAMPAIAFAVALVAGRAYRLRANAQATRISNLEKRVANLASSAVDAQSIAQRAARLEKLERAAAEPQVVPLDGAHEIVASLMIVARHQGLAIGDVLTQEQAAAQVRAASARHRPWEALPYLAAFPHVVESLSLTQARSLLKGLRRLGYLSPAIPLIQEIANRVGRPEDARAAALYESELALYRGEVDVEVDLPPLAGSQHTNVVLHVVGKALPETQSGYTLRTQYTVEAQVRAGLTPVVVAQSGASERSHAYTETYLHNGVRYYLLGGPQRGAVPWDEWLRANVTALADVVNVVRPGVLHVHSDFMNAMIALPVARAYAIPLVNETRGFWEESWLSRTATDAGWCDLDEIEANFGLPDMYRLRLEREAQLRSQSDAVVTLARVMRAHVVNVGERLGLHVPPVSIAPNAVDPQEFPVAVPIPALREELGFEPETVVVGYISSIVEYEGIDTLIRAMFELEVAIEAARLAEGSMETAGDATVPRPHSAIGFETFRDTGPGDPAPAVHPRREQAEPRISVQERGLHDESRAALLSPLHSSLTESVRAFGGPPPEAPDLANTGIRQEACDQVEEALDGLVLRLRSVHPEMEDATLRNYGHELIKAVAPFAWNPVRLLVVGDGPELQRLRSLAKDLTMTSVVFTGQVPHERVLDYYASIDLFVVPRKRAAVTELVTPLKPFEAMSTGRPCVFSDVGALQEIAEDSGAAELFRAGDHHDLATRVAALLADPDRLAEISRKGIEWVRGRRTWDLNALTYLDVYRSLGLDVKEPGDSTAVSLDGIRAVSGE